MRLWIREALDYLVWVKVPRIPASRTRPGDEGENVEKEDEAEEKGTVHAIETGMLCDLALRPPSNRRDHPKRSSRTFLTEPIAFASHGQAWRGIGMGLDRVAGIAITLCPLLLFPFAHSLWSGIRGRGEDG